MDKKDVKIGMKVKVIDTPASRKATGIDDVMDIRKQTLKMTGVIRDHRLSTKGVDVYFEGLGDWFWYAYESLQIVDDIDESKSNLLNPLGTKFEGPNGLVYVLSRVGSSMYALVGVDSGTIWSLPQVFVSFSNGLSNAQLIKLMNESDDKWHVSKPWPRVVKAEEKVNAKDIEFPVHKAHKVKPDVITVTRFFRPLDENGMKISSKGITAIFTVNYVTKKFKVLWSVCNGDNFDKQTGIDMARKNWKRGIDGDFYKDVSLFDNLFGAVSVSDNVDKNLNDMLADVWGERN